MKSTQKLTGTTKRVYSKPQVSRIRLDNEISMVMATPSKAPQGDPENPGGYLPQDRFNNDPFKIYNA